MKDTFGTPQEQARRLIYVLHTPTHPLHAELQELLTVKQFNHLVELAQVPEQTSI